METMIINEIDMNMSIIKWKERQDLANEIGFEYSTILVKTKDGRKAFAKMYCKK